MEQDTLATMSFAALGVVDTAKSVDPNTFLDSKQLQISKERQCTWRTGICVDGKASELYLGLATSRVKLLGTMARDIGPLKNLKQVDVIKYTILLSLKE